MRHFPYIEQKLEEEVESIDIKIGFKKLEKYLIYFCPECKTANKVLARFCRKCGFEFTNKDNLINKYQIKNPNSVELFDKTIINEDKINPEKLEKGNFFIAQIFNKLLIVDESGQFNIYNIHLPFKRLSKLDIKFNSKNEKIIDVKAGLNNLFVLTDRELKSIPISKFENLNNEFILKKEIEHSFGEKARIINFRDYYVLYSEQDKDILSNFDLEKAFKELDLQVNSNLMLTTIYQNTFYIFYERYLFKLEDSKLETKKIENFNTRNINEGQIIVYEEDLFYIKKDGSLFKVDQNKFQEEKLADDVSRFIGISDTILVLEQNRKDDFLLLINIKNNEQREIKVQDINKDLIFLKNDGIFAFNIDDNKFVYMKKSGFISFDNPRSIFSNDQKSVSINGKILKISFILNYLFFIFKEKNSYCVGGIVFE